jgi:hypothetical protein
VQPCSHAVITAARTLPTHKTLKHANAGARRQRCLRWTMRAWYAPLCSDAVTTSCAWRDIRITHSAVELHCPYRVSCSDRRVWMSARSSTASLQPPRHPPRQNPKVTDLVARLGNVLRSRPKQLESDSGAARALGQPPQPQPWKLPSAIEPARASRLFSRQRRESRPEAAWRAGRDGAVRYPKRGRGAHNTLPPSTRRVRAPGRWRAAHGRAGQVPPPSADHLGA